MFWLDRSGKTRKTVVNNWYSGVRRGHWGRYGHWVKMNLDPLTKEVVIDDEAIYQGDGFHYSWRIRFS